jgi:hypothetical protein
MTTDRARFLDMTRRVGVFAHRWASMLTLPICLLLLGFDCTGCMDSTRPLIMPADAAVGEVGKAGGLPFTLSVPSDCQVRGAIPLELKVTNVTNHPWPDSASDYEWPSSQFAVWLIHDGQQVSLSQSGEKEQPRRTVIVAVGAGGPPHQLDAGESKVMHIDLATLFDVTAPGEYTVLAARGPFFGDPDANSAAKTSFTLLP